MAKLTPAQTKAAQAWLHDVLVWGGMVSSPIRDIPLSDYQYMYGLDSYNPGSYYATYGKSAAKKICDAIRYRPVDIKKLNEYSEALANLADCKYVNDLHATQVVRDNVVRPKAETLAKYVAYFCAANGFWWNDSIASKYEMDEIKNNLLGNALFEFNCFASQETPSQAPAQSSRTRSTSSNQANNAAPTNGYKASGAHSGDIPNLIGTAGAKVDPGINILFCIEADKTGKNTPNAFITPLKQDGSKVSKDSAEHVNFGSGNGYTDCKLWFTSLNTANAFLNDIVARYGSKFTNIHVSKAKADVNGYFLVSTEFGQAYIKANKLNEQVLEETTVGQAEMEKDLQSEADNMAMQIGDDCVAVDRFEEALLKSI